MTWGYQTLQQDRKKLLDLPPAAFLKKKKKKCKWARKAVKIGAQLAAMHKWPCFYTAGPAGVRPMLKAAEYRQEVAPLVTPKNVLKH